MEQLQQREWCELRSNTWRFLRERDHILVSKHRPLLQYLVMPSFSDTWCIDVVRSGDVLAAYYTIWRMTRDIEHFTTAVERLKHPRPYVPTVESKLLNVSQGEISSLLTKLGRTRIPLQSTTNSVWLDGIGYELQIGDGWTGVTLQWHNNLPDEWPSELHDIMSALNELERQLAVHASGQSDEREPEKTRRPVARHR